MTSHRAGAIATAVVSAVLGLAAIGYVAGAFNATEAATIKAMKARITATEQVNAAQQLQLDDLQAQLDAAEAAPFSFSNITATVGADAVVIEWDVTPCATGQVMYGTTTAYGKVTPLEPALLCHHRQRITGLVPGTTYHYAVVATDGAGARTVVQVA